MPSQVQTSSNLGLSKGQHRTALRNPRGNQDYYSFYIDSSSDLVYEWSANGTTWTGSANAVSGADTIDSFDVKMRDDGSQLVVFVAWHSGTATRYRRGTVGDSADTITWGAGVQTIDASVGKDLPGAHCIAIARTANGRLVVAFSENLHDKCKDYRLTKLIGSNNDGATPTWSGETIWDDPTGSSNNQNKDEVWFGLESMSGDRFLIYARVPDSSDTTAYSVQSAPPTWNGTSFGNTGKAPVGSGTGTRSGDPLSAVVDADNRAHIIYMTSAGLAIQSKRAANVDDDDWGGPVAVKSNDIDACTLAINRANILLESGFLLLLEA